MRAHGESLSTDSQKSVGAGGVPSRYSYPVASLQIHDSGLSALWTHSCCADRSYHPSIAVPDWNFLPLFATKNQHPFFLCVGASSNPRDPLLTPATNASVVASGVESVAAPLNTSQAVSGPSLGTVQVQSLYSRSWFCAWARTAWPSPGPKCITKFAQEVEV